MASISETIKLARVLCIFFVMFVHVYVGYSGFPVLRGFDVADIVYHVMFDLLGRSSLPLLTVISGWLTAAMLRPYAKAIRGRIKTLIIPLALWNLLMLVALVGWSIMSGDTQKLPHSPLALLDDLFALTQNPANVPLGFLRDLFVVSLLSPLLLIAVKRFPLPTVAALFLVAAVFPYTPIILRTQIAFFFALGIWVHQTGFKQFTRAPLLAMGAYVAGVFGYKMWALANGAEWAMPEVVALVLRISISGLLWQVCRAAVDTAAGRTLVQLEPFTFLAFCSHVLVFLVLAVPGQHIFGDLTSRLYPVYFFLQPIMGYAAAIALAWVLSPVPGVLTVLNAGRNPWGPRRIMPAEFGRATKPV